MGHINWGYHRKCLGAYGAFHKTKEAFELGEVSAEDAVATCNCLLDGLRALDGQQLIIPTQSPRETAWAVWQKTGGKCTYCDCVLNPFCRMDPDGFQIDHVIPRVQGGTDDIENLVPSCRECNGEKWGRTPEQWRATHV